jgi:hypothetical protein
MNKLKLDFFHLNIRKIESLVCKVATPFLFSGTSLRIRAKTIPDSRILSIIKDLHIIDTIKGLPNRMDKWRYYLCFGCAT